MAYRISPYILYQPDGILFNLLTYKSIDISPQILNTLQTLGKNFSMVDAGMVLNMDGISCKAFINRLLRSRILIGANKEVFRIARVRFADIEICSHCNARCTFCPASGDPLPARVMPNDVFTTIVEKLQPLHLLRVTLNHYNEPLLDPDFLTKASILKQYDLRMRLYTNGILFSPAHAKFLAKLGIVESVVMNIPCVEAEEYRRLMGVKLSDRLWQNLRAAVECGLSVHICVNGAYSQAMFNRNALKQYLRETLRTSCRTYVNFTHDRAGLVKTPDVFTNGCWDGALGGCRRMFEHLHVNVEGKVFLCCQDYHQKYIIGDLLSQNADEIVGGDTMVEYRRKIFGDLPAADLICRFCAELQTTRINTCQAKL